ncbi:MAG: hypothetical protein AAFZ65_20510, partial [Planctomycetota bacterium]
LQQGVVGATLRFPILTEDLNEEAEALSLDSVSGSITLRLQKPSGVVVDVTASVQDPPSAGIVEYVTVAGDLDQLGPYKVQALIPLAGSLLPTEIGAFDVVPSLPAPTT